MKKPLVGEALSVQKRNAKAKSSAVSKKSGASSRSPVKKLLPQKLKEKSIKEKQQKKTAPQKVTKHLSVKQIEEDARKIEIIENIARKRQPPEEVLPKIKRPNPALALLGSQLQIALMSPFRIKFDQAQVASNVARYAGTAFVVVGAFLTLYNMNAVASFMDVSSRALPAQTTTCVAGTYCQSTSGTTTQISGGTGSSPSPNLDPTPDVDFSIESSGNTITGTTLINVTVPYATRVDLIARNLETNQSQTVGTLYRVSDLLWRAYWQTSAFSDGQYQLRAVVTNQFGTYTQESQETYAVLNHPVNDDPSTTGTTNPSNSTTTNTTSTGSPTPTTTTTTILTDTPLSPSDTSLPMLRVVLAMSEPLRAITRIQTFVMGATGVQHFIRRQGTTNYTVLGNPILHSASTGEWRFPFNTQLLADGEYDILTRAFFQNNTHTTRLIESVSIENTDTALLQTDEVNVPDDVVDAPQAEDIDPQIYFEFTKSNPMSGAVDVYMNVDNATFIELYVRPEGSLIQRYLGLAAKQSEDAWRYRLETTSLPNGAYGLFAKVRSQYGDSTSELVPISIRNTAPTATLTEEKQTYLDSLKAIGEESKTILGIEPIKQIPLPVLENDESEEPRRDAVPQYEELAKEVGEDYTDEVTNILEAFDVDLRKIMNNYGRAMREGDEEKARTFLGELEILRDEVVRSLPYGEEQSEILGKIRNYIETIIKDIRERTEKSETLIKERVGDAVLKDSDNDGVSDYDEVNIYSTDPLSADTDNDGYIDGIEILNGYNPKDSTREANVVYESPKEQGIVRDDILEITYITTLIDELNEIEQVKAQIGGRALPNSFVTVYIYSTPIVVTLKTDDEGSWNYIFDKELEDGEHEIYIGMTDNAGKIVAKSNPLSFIKTAEAFTVVDDQSAVMSIEKVEPSLMSDRALLVIASVSVVALGLVLILLGLHVRPKELVSQFA